MVTPDYRCSFNGVTEGANIDAASTSSGSGALINTGSTTKAVALAASAIRGARGARINATGVDCWYYWTFTDAESVTVQVYLTIATADLPTATQDFLQIRDATGRRVSCRFNTTGVLQAHDAAGTARWTTTTKPADGDYVLTLQAYRGTTNANGKLAVTLRKADDDTVVSSTPAGGTAVTGLNTGGANTPYTTVRFMKVSSTGNWTMTWDEPAVVFTPSAATDFLGEIDRVSAIAAPGTFAGESFSREPGTIATLDGSESDGVITDWHWDLTAVTDAVVTGTGPWTVTDGTWVRTLTLTDANTSTPSFETPGDLQERTYTFELETENSGVFSDSPDPVDVTVPAVTEVLAWDGDLYPLQLLFEVP